MRGQRMLSYSIIIVALAISLTECIPLPASLPPQQPGDIQALNHQVDKMEVHHDVGSSVHGQELANDQLPLQGGKEPNLGDSQQQQQPPLIADQGTAPKQQQLPAHSDHTSKLQQLPAHLEQQQQQQPRSPADSENVVDLDFVGRLKKLPVEKLVPADHMDVVRMEQDGHINQDYHKEMFLGGQHDEFKTETLENAENKLKEIIAKVDTNKDGFLSESEMEKWILKNMMDHLAQAKEENALIFKHLDPDGDGFVKWKEYYVHYLLSRNVSAKNAWQHVADYDDSVTLDQKDRDALSSFKYKWVDADKDPTDNQLSEAEFLSFHHPEHRRETLKSMAENVLRGIDTNDDGLLTEEEFIALPPGEVEGSEFIEMDRKWQEERRAEFREIMDENHDNQVDLKELMNYLDPTNPAQAKLEAGALMKQMDEDKNNLLDLDEILKHSDIFISSKVFNFGANVHDEF